jgi:DNA polymerase I-like protein with 3'-5' exonuclease and polymerase domains
MRDVALEEIKEYAAEDDVTFQLKNYLQLNWKTQTNKLFEDIEILPARSAMETEGINLDVSLSEKHVGEMQKEIDTFEQKNI